MTRPAKDDELLDGLTHKIRVATLSQIGRWLWRESTRHNKIARNHLKALEAEGLIRCFRVEAHPEIALTEPVIAWRCGGAPPDFAAASYRLKSRWSRPSVSTLCVIATERAGRLFGGHGGRYPRESEETHDIHLTAVYLQLQERSPELAAHWISEEEIRRRRSSRGEKLPDALIDHPSARKIVEFGGAYRKEKLRAFHAYCEELGLPYEVW